MDQGEFANIPCKISIINQYGELILDTLIHDEGKRLRSCEIIHGIPGELLSDAPSRESVVEHIQAICKDCIWIGHSVKYDLKVIGLGDVEFIDTSTLEDDR